MSSRNTVRAMDCDGRATGISPHARRDRLGTRALHAAAALPALGWRVRGGAAILAAVMSVTASGVRGQATPITTDPEVEVVTPIDEVTPLETSQTETLPAEPAELPARAEDALSPEPSVSPEEALVPLNDVLDAPAAPAAPAPGATRPATTPAIAAPATRPVAAADAGTAHTDDAAAKTATAKADKEKADKVVLLENVADDGAVHLLVGRSLVLKTRGPYHRVNVAQPDVLGNNELDDHTILVTAKKPGVAQMIVWDEHDRSQVVDINVDVDLNALGVMLKKTFKGAEIEVTGSNGAIVLRGRVPNIQVAEQATELVASYGKVLNFLELAGGQQVVLQVRFAEVSRSASTQLGFNFDASDGKFSGGYLKGPGADPIGGIASNKAGTVINPAVSIFGGGQVGNTALEGFVQAMRSNNLLRVLAEPNLIAISGQEASFLAGGEFPIPVPQAGGSGGTAITVEYKQFGVRLNFLPVVLGDGRIRLKVSPEVSDLDFSRSVSFNGFQIPSLTKRNVTTTIELNEGQTFAVAGLLNNRVNAANDVVPLLGDLPILGPLFRSVRYDRSETELVVLVTPKIVSGMNPGQVPELPGEHWNYPTENDLFWSQYIGGPSLDPKAPAQAGPVKFHGPYGFTPVSHVAHDEAH